MKINTLKYFLSLFILGITLNVSAAFKLTGNFPTFKNEAFRIVNNQSVLNDYRGELLSSGVIDEQGNFSTTLPISQQQEAILFINNTFYRIWIGEGDLSISMKDAILSFGGRYEHENTFLYRSKFMQPYLLTNALSYTSSQLGDYISYWDNLHKQRMELLKQAKAGQLSESFTKRIQGETLNSSLYAKNQFPLLRSIKAEELPANYHDFWKDFEILDDDPSQRNYMSALSDFTEYTIRTKFEKASLDRASLISKQIIFIDSILANRPKTREAYKGNLVLFVLKYIDNPALINELSNNFIKENPNSEYTILLKNKLKERESRLNKKISFSLKDVEGKNVSSESFLDKVVYVDFWGNWCKACLEEMPASAKLRKTFEGKDIVFLYIDFYDNKSIWLNAIKTHNIQGVNLKAESSDLLYFNEFFGVSQGFPRYAIIDKNGFLLTTAAPSPSDKTIVDVLEKLIKN